MYIIYMQVVRISIRLWLHPTLSGSFSGSFQVFTTKKQEFWTINNLQEGWFVVSGAVPTMFGCFVQNAVECDYQALHVVLSNQAPQVVLLCKLESQGPGESTTPVARIFTRYL